MLLEDLDSIEAVGHRVDDDVNVVELRRDGLRVVVALVLRPDDVHGVVTDVPLLVDLLGIALLGGHPCDVVEDGLHHRRRPVWCRRAGRACPSIQTAQEAAMRLQIDLQVHSHER